MHVTGADLAMKTQEIAHQEHTDEVVWQAAVRQFLQHAMICCRTSVGM